MKTYTMRRRAFWKTAEDLKRSAAISARVGNEEMADQVRWIRTYIVNEPDGTLGTVCVYQAVGPEALVEHARRVGMPAEDIVEVVDTAVIRPDPGAPAAA